MRFLCGSSGFSYKEWKGEFYPPKLKAGDMLAYYGERLPAVEINNTFYRLPKKDALQAWADQVPEDFRFVIKASRRITHMGRLSESTHDALGFLLENVRVLGSRLGAVLFQLPPTMRLNIERLKAFTAKLPDDLRYTFEFRHASWWSDDVYKLLRERDIALCVADEEEERKCSPMQSTASWGYLRLRRPDYDDASLDNWAQKIQDQKWDEAYVFFKHEAVNAPCHALDMIKRFA